MRSRRIRERYSLSFSFGSYILGDDGIAHIVMYGQHFKKELFRANSGPHDVISASIRRSLLDGFDASASSFSLSAL
jgi:hypothetical protein